MRWDVAHTAEFEKWLLSTDEQTQEKVVAMLPLLREDGPQLGRPFADTLTGSRYPNMKEMRPTSTIRVFFAFDPRRTAVLLIGGDKAGKKERQWYKEMLKRADRLYEQHLKEVKTND